MNCDGSVDLEDALAILLHLVGLEFTHNVPCPDIGSAIEDFDLPPP